MRIVYGFTAVVAFGLALITMIIQQPVSVATAVIAFAALGFANLTFMLQKRSGE